MKYTKNYSLCKLLIEQLKEEKRTINENYFLFKLEIENNKKIESYNQISTSRNILFSFSDFNLGLQNEFEVYLGDMESICLDLLHIWEMLYLNNINYLEYKKFIYKVQDKIKLLGLTVSNNFSKNKRTNYLTNKLLEVLEKFSSMVIHDNSIHNIFLEKYKNLFIVQSDQSYIRNNILNYILEGNAYIIVNGEEYYNFSNMKVLNNSYNNNSYNGVEYKEKLKKSFGDILGINASCCSIFGYEKNDLLAKGNVNWIIPSFIQSQHEKNLKKIFGNDLQANKTREFKRIYSLGVHKNGYVLPVNITFSILNGIYSKFSILGLIRCPNSMQQKNNTCYCLVDNNLVIHYISPKVTNLIGLKIKDLEKEYAYFMGNPISSSLALKLKISKKTNKFNSKQYQKSKSNKDDCDDDETFKARTNSNKIDKLRNNLKGIDFKKIESNYIENNNLFSMMQNKSPEMNANNNNNRRKNTTNYANNINHLKSNNQNSPSVKEDILKSSKTNNSKSKNNLNLVYNYSKDNQGSPAIFFTQPTKSDESNKINSYKTNKLVNNSKINFNISNYNTYNYRQNMTLENEIFEDNENNFTNTIENNSVELENESNEHNNNSSFLNNSQHNKRFRLETLIPELAKAKDNLSYLDQFLIDSKLNTRKLVEVSLFKKKIGKTKLESYFNNKNNDKDSSNNILNSNNVKKRSSKKNKNEEDTYYIDSLKETIRDKDYTMLKKNSKNGEYLFLDSNHDLADNLLNLNNKVPFYLKISKLKINSRVFGFILELEPKDAQSFNYNDCSKLIMYKQNVLSYNISSKSFLVNSINKPNSRSSLNKFKPNTTTNKMSIYNKKESSGNLIKFSNKSSTREDNSFLYANNIKKGNKNKIKNLNLMSHKNNSYTLVEEKKRKSILKKEKSPNHRNSINTNTDESKSIRKLTITSRDKSSSMNSNKKKVRLDKTKYKMTPNKHKNMNIININTYNKSFNDIKEEVNDNFFITSNASYHELSERSKQEINDKKQVEIFLAENNIIDYSSKITLKIFNPKTKGFRFLDYNDINKQEIFTRILTMYKAVKNNYALIEENLNLSNNDIVCYDAFYTKWKHLKKEKLKLVNYKFKMLLYYMTFSFLVAFVIQMIVIMLSYFFNRSSYSNIAGAFTLANIHSEALEASTKLLIYMTITNRILFIEYANSLLSNTSSRLLKENIEALDTNIYNNNKNYSSFEKEITHFSNTNYFSLYEYLEYLNESNNGYKYSILNEDTSFKSDYDNNKLNNIDHYLKKSPLSEFYDMTSSNIRKRQLQIFNKYDIKYYYYDGKDPITFFNETIENLNFQFEIFREKKDKVVNNPYNDLIYTDTLYKLKDINNTFLEIGILQLYDNIFIKSAYIVKYGSLYIDITDRYEILDLLNYNIRNSIYISYKDTINDLSLKYNTLVSDIENKRETLLFFSLILVILWVVYSSALIKIEKLNVKSINVLFTIPNKVLNKYTVRINKFLKFLRVVKETWASTGDKDKNQFIKNKRINLNSIEINSVNTDSSSGYTKDCDLMRSEENKLNDELFVLNQQNENNIFNENNLEMIKKGKFLIFNI